MSDIIDLIKRKVKIVDVLKDRGIVPSKSYSGKLIYKCPIHKGENSPSFYVYEKDTGDDFFCFGCKAGGNVIQLVKHMNSCSGKEAFRTVGELAGLDVDPYLVTYDLDCKLDPPDSFICDIDSIMQNATISFRKFRHLGVNSKVKNIEQHWKTMDEGYWTSNIDIVKEVSKWMLGR